MSFWYGLGFDEISNMPIAALKAYLDRLPARQSELKLLLSDAVSIPHMKENHRLATLNSWIRLAMPNSETAIAASPARLKMMGIGVRYVE